MKTYLQYSVVFFCVVWGVSGGVHTAHASVDALIAERDRARAVTPATIGTPAEPELSTITGTLNVFYYEDFDRPERSKTTYTIKASDRLYTLSPSSPLDITSGSIVSARGVVTDNTIVADQSQVTRISAPEIIGSVGPQKTLFLLFSYTNSAPPPQTPEEIYNRTFHGQFQKFYAEQSYGNISFEGDVRGWYQLPRPDNCAQIDVEGPEFAQVVARNNIDLGRYDRLVIVSHGTCSSFGGVSSNGKVTVSVDGQQHTISIIWISVDQNSFTQNWAIDASGNNRYPFSWTRWDYILAHEMGHSLGVSHANGWDCGTTALYGAGCRHVEYGNNFDTMGIGSYGLHFNAFYKELLGWLTPRDALRITSSGRYTLGPLVKKEPVLATSASSKKFATISIPGTELKPFYLEYRKAAGFDAGLDYKDVASNQEGLFVNRIINSFTRFPRLLDLRPTTAPWDTDIQHATLNKSSSDLAAVFRDEQKGITIGPIVSVSPSAITFDVQIDPVPCVRGNPTVTIASNVKSLMPGQSAFVDVSFKNTDSYVCGTSDFVVEAKLDAAWKPLVTPAQHTVLRAPAPDEQAETGRKRVNFTVPADAQPGTYPLVINVAHAAGNTRTERTLSLVVADVPQIAQINPSSGTLETDIVITGDRFISPVQIGIYSQQAFGWATPSFADMNTLRFRMPATLTGFDCQCDVPTAPRMYELYVFTENGYAGPVMFELTPSKTFPATQKNVIPTRVPVAEVEAPEVSGDAGDVVVSETTIKEIAPAQEEVTITPETAEQKNVFEKSQELGATVFSGFVSLVQSLVFE